ncbi:MAG TPA: hypothetical protein VF148_05350 [Acidimicrobiia bacterium]
MKSLYASALVGLCLVATACGDSPAQLVVRGAGPHGCEYSGPNQISESVVELAATPSGQGHILAVIYELESEPADGEIDQSELRSVVATVENEDDVNLARRTAELSAGHYAIACKYGDFDGVVATLTVTP